MKRKRGNKKGKKKVASSAAKNEEAETLVTLIRDDNSDDEDDGNDDNTKDNNSNSNSNSNNEEEDESGVKVDSPSSTGTDQPSSLVSINPDGSVDKTSQRKSVGHVKVKLKTSKALESHSDNDKSSLQLSLEKQSVVGDKAEDTGNSVAEVKTAFSSGTVSKKFGIKIKPSKAVSDTNVQKNGGAFKIQDEKLQQNEPRTPRQESQYNKQELGSALDVIKKVMKMDAAEPFNVPVNPEALGIPDYFDIIDTPMDFGTICGHLEKGEKYMNSEDVYQDVQFIWNNCYKYNSKGDYVVDLMKRVKKNFMKYWTAAGLYTEHSRGSSGAEGTQGEDVGTSTQEQGKSGQTKQKTKKRHGRRHKSDCLCAICVLKRRRREREENERLANQKLAQELKQEGSSFVESPNGEDSSSNMDESLEPDGEADMGRKGMELKIEDNEQQYSADKEKHKGIKVDDDDEENNEEEDNDMEIRKKGKFEALEQSEFADRSGDEAKRQLQPGLADNAVAVQTNSKKDNAMEQHEGESAAVQRNKYKESQQRHQRMKMLDKFRHENPMLLSLCQRLFPDNNHKSSFWSGPHSLVPYQVSDHKNSIGAAIESLMK